MKWEHLDKTILNKKIDPFLKKKVVEYIGDESIDLVKFMLEKIEAHGDVQSIFEELEPVPNLVYLGFVRGDRGVCL